MYWFVAHLCATTFTSTCSFKFKVSRWQGSLARSLARCLYPLPHHNPSLSLNVSLYRCFCLSRFQSVRRLVHLMTSQTDGPFLCPFPCLSVSLSVSPMFASVYICPSRRALFSEACALNFFVFRHTDTSTYTTDTILTLTQLTLNWHWHWQTQIQQQARHTQTHNQDLSEPQCLHFHPEAVDI
jgi:hypothetical protein